MRCARARERDSLRRSARPRSTCLSEVWLNLFFSIYSIKHRESHFLIVNKLLSLSLSLARARSLSVMYNDRCYHVSVIDILRSHQLCEISLYPSRRCSRERDSPPLPYPLPLQGLRPLAVNQRSVVFHRGSSFLPRPF